MSSQWGLTVATLTSLAQQIKSAIPRRILERGLDYYNNGHVLEIQVEGSYIRAQVAGGEVYSVTLDTQLLQLGSHCTCPYGLLCKHMAAVFFAVYSDAEPHADRYNVDSFFGGSLSPSSNHGRILPSRAVNQKEKQKENRKVPPPEQYGRSEDWWAFIQEELKGKNPVLEISDFVISHSQRLQDVLLRYAGNWSKPQMILFDIYVYLAMLQWWSQQMSRLSMQASWLASHLDEAIYETLYSVEHMLEDENAERWNRVEEADFQFLQATLHSILQDSDADSLYLVRAYQVVWDEVLRHHGDISAEVSWLKPLVQQTPGVKEVTRAKESPNTQTIAMGETGRARSVHRGKKILDVEKASVRNIENLRLALGHLLAVSGKVRPALSTMREPHSMYLDVYFRTLYTLENLKRWDDMWRLLNWVSRCEKELAQSDIQRLANAWMHLDVSATSSSEALSDMERYLQRHLPTTAGQYEMFLIGTENYATWVELRLLLQTPPEDIGPQIMARVEKHHPSSLLPLWHQSIEWEVAHRNRQAYQVAAARLLQLRKLYRKLKRQDDWMDFLQLFKARYSRLRALQEELDARRV